MLLNVACLAEKGSNFRVFGLTRPIYEPRSNALDARTLTTTSEKLMFKHEQMFILLITTLVSTTNANSSGFTIVLKHNGKSGTVCICLSTGPRWPGGISSFQKKFFTMDFCLCGGILNLSDLKQRNISTIRKFPEHVCLTACVGLPGLSPSGPK